MILRTKRRHMPANVVICFFQIVPLWIPQCQNLCTGGSAPTIKNILIIASAMIIVPHTALLKDFRDMPAMTKRIRFKIHLHRIRFNSQKSRQILFCIENVSSHSFCPRHIFIRFHPSRRKHFPLALMDILSYGF